MSNFSELTSEILLEILNSLSEEKLEELYKEVLQILDIYKKNFLLGEFIKKDYQSFLKDRHIYISSLLKETLISYK